MGEAKLRPLLQASRSGTSRHPKGRSEAEEAVRPWRVVERRLPGAQIQPWCASRRFVCEVSEVDPHQPPIRIEQLPRCCGPRVPPASESMPRNVIGSSACPF